MSTAKWWDAPRPMLAFRDRAKTEDPSNLIADAIRAGVDINSLSTPTKQDRQSLRALKLAITITRRLQTLGDSRTPLR
ncbi:hypothetical protein IU433_14795 [Nocardia puris]|uniref:hypothetical protein n=1 Tax=Nocardia puris TaxID=208602 RepID=UPI001894F0F1|nr:hypothetical protein [Nocardia puris]MBF6216052.1 hypothetical protein [Nocardia puris]MBF6366050.1 hypothetical protein [Nocardia puris]MBF6460307.1 hypothetical protein [Nocardia puris]